MTEKGYLACMEFFKNHQALCRVAKIVQKGCEIAIYLAYPLFILALFLLENPLWWRSMLVCGGGFIAVTVVRKLVNATRPYEKYGFTPLIKKDKKGQSFPSRHAYSAMVIAVNIALFSLPVGIGFIVAALLIAFLRVVLGVHFIKDVAFGCLCGVAIGLLALI